MKSFRNYGAIIALPAAALLATVAMAQDTPATAPTVRTRPPAKFIFTGRGGGPVTVIENGKAEQVEAPVGVVVDDPDFAAREERRKAELDEQAARREERLKEEAAEAEAAPVDGGDAAAPADAESQVEAAPEAGTESAPADEDAAEPPAARAGDNEKPQSKLAPAKKKEAPAKPESKAKAKPKPKPGEKPGKKTYEAPTKKYE